MLSATVFNSQKKSGYTTKLNLVALMDIFTILVFFLLLNHGDSRNIADAKFVTLPSASVGVAPHEDMKIHIGADEIWLNDEPIVMVRDVLSDAKKGLEPLSLALSSNTERKELSAFEKENGLAITILGDKTTSYELLKAVMTTCRLNDYRNISLATNRVVRGVYSPGSTSQGAAP